MLVDGLVVPINFVEAIAVNRSNMCHPDDPIHVAPLSKLIQKVSPIWLSAIQLVAESSLAHLVCHPYGLRPLRPPTHHAGPPTADRPLHC